MSTRTALPHSVPVGVGMPQKAKERSPGFAQDRPSAFRVSNYTTRTDVEQEFRSQVAAGLRDVGDERAASKYEDCCKEGLGWYQYCLEDPEHYIKLVPMSCDLRICPTCARRHGAKLRARYLARAEEAMSKKWRRGWSMKLVTLTSSHELSGDVGALALGLLDAARDTYRALWGQHDGAGAFATLEFGERGKKAHVHMMVWGPYYWHGQIQQQWERLTGMTHVDVKIVTDPEKGVREVLKYIVKASGLTPGDLVDLHTALKGRRRVRAWGFFYATKDVVEEEHVCPQCGSQLGWMPEGEYERRLALPEMYPLILIQGNKSGENRGPPQEEIGPPTLFDWLAAGPGFGEPSDQAS